MPATPVPVAGTQQQVRVNEGSQSTVPVVLPVASTDTIATLTYTLVDLDDASACAVAPYVDLPVLAWYDAPTHTVQWQITPDQATLRHDPVLFYERRLAIFAYTGTSAAGRPLGGTAEVSLTIWNLAGYPKPIECEAEEGSAMLNVRVVNAATTLSPTDDVVWCDSAVSDGYTVMLPPVVLGKTIEIGTDRGAQSLPNPILVQTSGADVMWSAYFGPSQPGTMASLSGMLRFVGMPQGWFLYGAWYPAMVGSAVRSVMPEPVTKER